MHASFTRRQTLALLGGGITAASSAGAASAQANAQTWPDKPVRIVVAFAPGGSIDAFGRALANELQSRLGQPFVVENRPGGGGTMGTNQVARAAPDGYTLTVHSSTIGSMGPVQKNDFDASTDLTPIAMIARAPAVVIVSSELPVKSVSELIAYAKSNNVLYGSAGVGSTNHLQTELFNKRAGTALKHIPYKGLAGALQDLAGGRLHVIIGTIASAAGVIDSGKARVIAYAADARPQGTPEAPTVRAAGIDYEASIWWGLFGPPSLPSAIRDKLNAESNAALRDPSLAKILASAGALPAPMSPDDFTKIVKKEVAEVKEVVAAVKIVFE